MTLRRHLGGYALIGLAQWLLEYGLMLALSEWVMPVEPANVIGRVAGAMLGFVTFMHIFDDDHRITI